jgi:ABC-type amino acid transport substrate-binding protein
LIKREAGQPPAQDKQDGRIAMRLLISAAALLLAATFQASAQSAVPPDALKDLAPTGKLRAAINFGNGVLAQKGKDGEPQGITPDLANALGKRLGVPVELVRFEAAGKVAEALATSAVDVGFIAIEPVRADKIDFSPAAAPASTCSSRTSSTPRPASASRWKTMPRAIRRCG